MQGNTTLRLVMQHRSMSMHAYTCMPLWLQHSISSVTAVTVTKQNVAITIVLPTRYAHSVSTCQLPDHVAITFCALNQRCRREMPTASTVAQLHMIAWHFHGICYEQQIFLKTFVALWKRQGKQLVLQHNEGLTASVMQPDCLLA